MRSVTVLATGPRALVQDPGRPGNAHLGVPPSGALDAAALRLTNRLVGNPEGAPGLEALLGGLRLRANDAVTVAVTGAPVAVRAGGRAREHAAPLYLRAGEVVELGTPQRGMRCYVAVSGGLDVPRELGSAATDTLSGLGPAPPAIGDVLALGTPCGPPRGSDAAAAARWPATLRVGVLLGPRADHVERGAEQLRAGTWHVSERSDRIGLRLRGPALRRAGWTRGAELPSEPIRTGAIQVPADGFPLVFLADHPTTGGYPVVGVVDSAALDVLGQARPGTPVTFQVRQ